MYGFHSRDGKAQNTVILTENENTLTEPRVFCSGRRLLGLHQVCLEMAALVPPSGDSFTRPSLRVTEVQSPALTFGALWDAVLVPLERALLTPDLCPISSSVPALTMPYTLGFRDGSRPGSASPQLFRDMSIKAVNTFSPRWRHCLGNP